ncbi:hypothetical protein TKK_0004763 [Trichogramma kaykai]|uniref:Replication termination factor 2 n=1 Tax=Trichogramma kaykai TaxID=54128 RepID=A0ABD2XK83_9HYME
MGCDGGTIPRRDELVRIKKKPEQKDKDAELHYRWKNCSIKQLPLQKPIVACGLGRLYSKEAVIEGLLDRSMLPESATHIKNLKDIKALELTENPAYKGEDLIKGGNKDNGSSQFICPVTGLEMNGKHKFCFLWQCGCVMSERALKEIKGNNCHKCSATFVDDDIVVLNPDDEDLTKMMENLESRRKSKSKKRKNIKEEKSEVKEETGEPSQKKKDKKDKSTSSDSKKVMPARSQAKVPKDPKMHKMSGDYSVAQDPNVSEVVKSLFTTHKSEKEQTRAHWVTFNPFYN